MRLRAARASGGEAALFCLADGEELEVTLSRELGPPAYAVVGELALRFRGQVGPEGQRVLAVLTRLVEGLRGRIPPDLDSPTLIGLGSMPAHRALAFAFPFCTAERSRTPSGDERIEEVLVRLTGRCNQACPFCSAPVPRSEPSLVEVERLLGHVARAAPSATVTLTGGEPTLRDDLPYIVSRTLASAATVEVQTNAVRLADPALASSFERSARLRFFVSLHALDESTYDACTGTRGMLPRAVAGIHHLRSQGHEVVLSVVVGALNSETIVKFTEEISHEFGEGAPLALHFSVTLCPEHRPTAADHIVRYSELAPRLEAAFDRAVELGLRPEPLLSSSHAAIPPCFLGSRWRSRRGPMPVLEHQGPEAAGSDEGWQRGERCRDCGFSGICPGIPRSYADRFGLDELDV